MTTGLPGTIALQAADPSVPTAEPPGERYYRHPGDVVRLVVWGVLTLLLVLLVEFAAGTDNGVTGDLAHVSSRIPRPVRQFALALVQIAAVAIPAAALVVLVWQRRWRRTLVCVVGGIAGATAVLLSDAALDLSGSTRSSLPTDSLLGSPDLPPLAYVGALAAMVTVGKPWLQRSWRRAADVALAVLILTMALAGSTALWELLLVLTAGLATGALVLVVVGAPNRRPSPLTVATALRAAGIEVGTLTLQRAEGGRAQLYDIETASGGRAFAKVYSQDSRDADLLFRSYRSLTLRNSDRDRPSMSLAHTVEHEALLLSLAREAGVTVPVVLRVAGLPDGSMVLATERVDGQRLDSLAPEVIDDKLLAAVWREVTALHRAHLAHRALRAANILVSHAGVPTVIDLGFGAAWADERLVANDQAELIASVATLIPPGAVIESAAQALDPDELAAVSPFLQPLALTAATRKQSSKSQLAELRAGIETATGRDPAPLERLVRVRPRTLVMIATGAGAFYVLLPQLAHVGDSFKAMGTANWGWIAVCVAMSALTYVASAVALAGSVPRPVPFSSNVEAQMASSFVNRVTPANVGGMALSVRFLQKAGIEPAEAVTGLGLNVLVGAIVHVLLLGVFLAFARTGGTGGFKVPSGSKLLLGIAVALAIIGVVAATRRGRRLFRSHVLGQLKKSAASLAVLARSPLKLAGLVGGSAGVTLAYIGALAAAIAAFHGHITLGEVGAVYLGASIIAAAAPTPGGLGAMEAALVAGLTGTGMQPGVAVAAVLGYRLATYWLPVLPGWLSFRQLERRNFI